MLLTQDVQQLYFTLKMNLYIYVQKSPKYNMICLYHQRHVGLLFI